MYMFDIKDEIDKLLNEFHSSPTRNYWVEISYYEKKNPNKILTLEFAQFDNDPFFPRTYRMFNFLKAKMKDFEFIDLEVIPYLKEVPKYVENFQTEFTIH